MLNAVPVSSCPVYLINLPRDRERGEQMHRQIDVLQLETRHVEAVYGRDLDAAQLDTLYSPQLNRARFHKPLSPGEIGCYASHLRVWELMRDDSAPMALVLEDDVVLGPELPALLDAVARLPARWDMIKLLGREYERVAKRWPLLDRWGVVRYRRVPSLTGAYLLSREGACRLAASRRPFYRPVDVDLRFWWETDLRVYGLLPYPVSLGEASHISTLGPREPVGGLGYRLRKFRGQLHYTLGSVIANFRTRHDILTGP